MKCNEEFVYQAVLNGDLEIMPDGTIWRAQIRRGCFGHDGAIVAPIKRRRAERRKKDYLCVVVRIAGSRQIGVAAHRLVYRHFKGPIPDGLTINHKDGKKRRNTPDNLELATFVEQMAHARDILKIKIGYKKGGRHLLAKLTAKEVRTIRRRAGKGETHSLIAAHFAVSREAISCIARRETWAHLR